jgi:hypothetical protein
MPGQQQRSPGLGRCYAVLFCVAACIYLVLVAGIELLGAHDGRRIVHGLESAARGSLVSVPQSKRGSIWAAAEFSTSAFVTLPLFLSAGQTSGARRKPFLDTMREANGAHTKWPFFDGFAVSALAEINATLQTAATPAHLHIGAQKVPERCLDYSGLLNKSRARGFLTKQLITQLAATDGKKPPLLPSVSGQLPRTAAVKLAVARRVFWRLWNAEIPPDAEQPILEYFEWGWNCILLQRFHIFTGNVVLAKLDRIRAAARQAVRETPAAQAFHAAALAHHSETSSSSSALALADDLLVTATDGMLFSCLLLAHLTSGVMERIEESPATMLPLWKADPRAFLVEHARLDPPLSSVSAETASKDETDVKLGMGALGYQSVMIPKGTTVQLLLGMTNIDKARFGGPLHLLSRARSFDPTRSAVELNQVLLSWTGLIEDVQVPRPLRPVLLCGRLTGIFPMFRLFLSEILRCNGRGPGWASHICWKHRVQ